MITHRAFYKIWTAILALAVLSNAVSFALFIAKPENFYYRPWEFFDEVAYRFKRYSPRWHGDEISDLTRDHRLFFQDPHPTTVTTDRDGFRSTPPSPDYYDILMTGDSTLFGSGLSDNETLPWILAQKTGLYIYNGARSTLPNLLKRADLADTRIIIDVRTERTIKRGVFTDYYGINKNIEYTPLLLNDIPFKEIAQRVPAQRYLVTSIVLRDVKRLFNDLPLLFRNDSAIPEYRFHSHRMASADLAAAVDDITERSKKYRADGYRYIFIAVPAKQTLYDDTVDQYTQNYINYLNAALSENGVETVSLLAPFKREAYQKLYRQYDTHWNRRGTELAAEVLSKYFSGAGI